mmetsp:Transcript_22925/g.50964  ORF Transcript_22925/g.50964 Transcript_22925/m.50964 type:complete len:224 (-) Transcript_22925:595-1266(-)
MMVAVVPGMPYWTPAAAPSWGGTRSMSCWASLNSDTRLRLLPGCPSSMTMSPSAFLGSEASNSNSPNSGLASMSWRKTGSVASSALLSHTNCAQAWRSTEALWPAESSSRRPMFSWEMMCAHCFSHSLRRSSSRYSLASTSRAISSSPSHSSSCSTVLVYMNSSISRKTRGSWLVRIIPSRLSHMTGPSSRSIALKYSLRAQRIALCAGISVLSGPTWKVTSE